MTGASFFERQCSFWRGPDPTGEPADAAAGREAAATLADSAVAAASYIPGEDKLKKLVLDGATAAKAGKTGVALAELGSASARLMELKDKSDKADVRKGASRALQAVENLKKVLTLPVK